MAFGSAYLIITSNIISVGGGRRLSEVVRRLFVEGGTTTGFLIPGIPPIHLGRAVRLAMPLENIMSKQKDARHRCSLVRSYASSFRKTIVLFVQVKKIYDAIESSGYDIKI